jgi:Glycosyltransferase family 87
VKIRKEHVFPGLVVAAIAVAALPALIQLGWHARLFASRATFPLDLEWMEGGVLLHAQRIAQGQGIYVEPSLDFIPFLYTPLYPALLALLSFVLPLGYLLGRLVSIAAFTGALALVVVTCLGETQDRWRRILAVLAGIASAGAIAASFAFTGYFYDLVRSDSLLLALEALALWLALRGRGWKSAALAGLLIALGFFAKQTATIMGAGLGLGLLVTNFRRGLVYALAAAAALAAGIGLLVKTSGGWFWTYIFKLHQSHAFRKEAVTDIALPFTQQFAWPLFLALILVIVGLALSRKLRRSDAILFLAAACGEITALVGFATQWADSNAFIPAIFFPAFATAVLAARLFDVALAGRKWGALVVAAAVALLLGSQSLHTGPPTPVRGRDKAPIFTAWPRLGHILPTLASAVPSAQDRMAAGRLLDELRALPEPLFIPFHTYYAVLAGKQPFAHRMGVRDVEAALGRPKGLDQAILDQRFAAIVLDWKSYPGEWPNLDRRYHAIREFAEGVDSVRTFAGAQTSPRTLLVPTREPPPVPPGGHRLADFESGDFAGFSALGTAFGAEPAPAPAGMYGLFAADSGRAGAQARGILRAQPFVVDAAHLRFALAGPADPGLRVVLREGETVLVSASPTGAARLVEWNTSAWVGQSVELVLEDDSTTGALSADEFVAY